MTNVTSLAADSLVGYDQQFAPFVEMLTEIGGPIGSFDARHIYPDAPDGIRYLCFAFRSGECAQGFYDEVNDRLARDALLRELAVECGPGMSIPQLDGGLVLVFWPGLYGKRLSRN